MMGSPTLATVVLNSSRTEIIDIGIRREAKPPQAHLINQSIHLLFDNLICINIVYIIKLYEFNFLIRFLLKK